MIVKHSSIVECDFVEAGNSSAEPPPAYSEEMTLSTIARGAGDMSEEASHVEQTNVSLSTADTPLLPRPVHPPVPPTTEDLATTPRTDALALAAAYPATPAVAAAVPQTPAATVAYTPTPGTLAVYPPPPAASPYARLPAPAARDVHAHILVWRTVIVILVLLLIAVIVVLVLRVVVTLVVSRSTAAL
ncbi:hypothetical protein C8T65DRAFT_746135 [Cerioporus squamosus]|nr:hypothetical protein C8T65DRAFT_746135 [Cerioporus squamosus]